MLSELLGIVAVPPVALAIKRELDRADGLVAFNVFASEFCSQLARPLNAVLFSTAVSRGNLLHTHTRACLLFVGHAATVFARALAKLGRHTHDGTAVVPVLGLDVLECRVLVRKSRVARVHVPCHCVCVWGGRIQVQRGPATLHGVCEMYWGMWGLISLPVIAST